LIRYQAEKELREPLICFSGEYFYAQKGNTMTPVIKAQVAVRYHPWDSSFPTYYSGEGVRYNFSRGVVGSAMCPYAVLFGKAKSQLDSIRGGIGVVITNRLAWGPLRNPDVVIGSGTVSKNLLLFDQFKLL
jgi:hypothetical protein